MTFPVIIPSLPPPARLDLMEDCDLFTDMSMTFPVIIPSLPPVELTHSKLEGVLRSDMFTCANVGTPFLPCHGQNLLRV